MPRYVQMLGKGKKNEYQPKCNFPAKNNMILESMTYHMNFARKKYNYL
jgi:hypothetical protein